MSDTKLENAKYIIMSKLHEKEGNVQGLAIVKQIMPGDLAVGWSIVALNPKHVLDLTMPDEYVSTYLFTADYDKCFDELSGDRNAIFGYVLLEPDTDVLHAFLVTSCGNDYMWLLVNGRLLPFLVARKPETIVLFIVKRLES